MSTMISSNSSAPATKSMSAAEEIHEMLAELSVKSGMVMESLATRTSPIRSESPEPDSDCNPVRGMPAYFSTLRELVFCIDRNMDRIDRLTQEIDI